MLLKDNIATDDAMQTTAGSLALVGSRVPARRGAGGRLRDGRRRHPGQGEPLRVGELPRLSRSSDGWSARGGFTPQPLLTRNGPVRVELRVRRSRRAANLCAVAVGTETDGSIICPAGHNSVVGLKPTVGLVSRRRHHPDRPQPGHGRADGAES